MSTNKYPAFYDRFTLWMSEEQAKKGFHMGRCDNDVLELVKSPDMKAQLDTIPDDEIKAELRNFGAWDEDELNNPTDNRLRIVWLACGDIAEAMLKEARFYYDYHRKGIQ